MYCKLRRLELLRSGQLSDCELHVRYKDGCGRRCLRQFRCHKAILASSSTEFQRMIEDPEFMGVMVVNDASPEAYEALLLYFYTYEIYSEINIEMCPELIQLSAKYKVPDFIDCYIRELSAQEWPLDKVMKIFQLADAQSRPAIMKLVEEKIRPNAVELLNSSTFVCLSVPQIRILFNILKSLGTLPDLQLLMTLKKYQEYNKLGYDNMECFQEFVQVTNLFGDILFEPDGTLIVHQPEDKVKPEDKVETAAEEEIQQENESHQGQ